MSYQELSEFLQERMRMSHIYQPVMLMTLLEHGGECSASDIAKSILSHDQSQIEYYEEITRDMVGRVLTSHGLVKRTGKNYSLQGFDSLTPAQIKELISLCQAKLDEYIAKRGERIWQHRTLALGDISGSIKYEVLKAAKLRCELCGVSNDERALEVDHIVPRNKGGTDDLSNLQALCYQCNSMKRDKDDTDFRAIRASYSDRMKGCLFCELPAQRVLLQNELAFAIHDAFAVTELHTLIIPKRHVSEYFSLYRPELIACNALLMEAKQMIEKKDSSVSGFNIGVNNGESAGQTIFHCHMHLIPRRRGDVEDPRGGIRHTIPGKGNYTDGIQAPK